MDPHDEGAGLLRKKHAIWKSQLDNLGDEPPVSDAVRLSNDRQVLASQIFLYRPPGAHQPQYFKLDTFAARLRQHLPNPSQKTLVKLLLGTERQIGYLLAEILWEKLSEKVKLGCRTNTNCSSDWEKYLDSGLDPAEIKKDAKLVIQSSHPKLLGELKKVLDPSDPQLFCQVMQGPEESGRQLLPLLRPSSRHASILKVNPSNLPYLAHPLPPSCHRALVTASINHMLQCRKPEAVIQAIEKYLGTSRETILAKALERISTLQPSKQHLSILRESLKGQQYSLNTIIVNTAHNNLPLGKEWQQFLVQESNEFTLLPLLVLHKPTSWKLICTKLSPSAIQKNLLNTLLPSLQYIVEVKNWDIYQSMLEKANKTASHKNKPAPVREGTQSCFPTPPACDWKQWEGAEFPLLRQNPPVSVLRLLASLRTSPGRIIRDQLVNQGLIGKSPLWIKLGKKTPKSEQSFIETQVTAETHPQDLVFFAQHLPHQQKFLLETFLRRLSSKNTGTSQRPYCAWYKEQNQVQALEQLVLQTLKCFPEGRESILACLVRCNLIQYMPELAPHLVGREWLLKHATEENLQYLLEHNTYTGIKPELEALLNYHNPLKTVPLLHKAGIELSDAEFWHLATKANENITLLPLIRQLLKRNPPKTVDNDTLAELTESSLIALLLEYKVLQPSDTLDGRPWIEWLDREDLLEVLCRISLPADHPLLIHLAGQEPETAWHIVQKTIQTSHARENLAVPNKLELELF